MCWFLISELELFSYVANNLTMKHSNWNEPNYSNDSFNLKMMSYYNRVYILDVYNDT